MERIKVACVNYLNTKPLIHGLQKGEFAEIFELILATPAKCAELYKNNQVDIALVPIATLGDELGEHQIISNYCIGSDGPVNTVGIFSNTPIGEIDKIYLDNHSRTSQNLTKVIFEDYLNRKPQYKEVDVSKVKLSNNEGILLIGDKAFESKDKYEYYYDLAEMWTSFTALPFVFAVWVARGVDQETERLFNQGLSYGVNHINEVIVANQSVHPDVDLDTYYNKYIKFEYDLPKKKGMKKFLNSLKRIKDYRVT